MARTTSQQPTAAAPSRLDPWPLAIVALALISLGTPLCLLSGHELATQFQDDAFYYYQIAKNVAHGRGFTFDGLHETNGFHPLWLALLVPLFGWLPPLDAPVRAAGLLEALLLGGAAALVYAVIQRSAPRWTALASALFLFAPGTRMYTRVGMESALCMCLLSAIWYCATRLEQERITPVRLLSTGALCALAALARLEALCAVLCLGWLLRRQLIAAPTRALWLGGPPLLGSALYMAWSRVRFGTYLPVSGLVKQLQAGIYYSGAPELRFGPVAALLLIAAFTVALWHWLQPRLPWIAPLRFPLITAFGMLSLDFASLGLLEHWYMGVGMLALAPLSASLLRFSRKLTLLAAAGCAALALWRIPYTVDAVRRYDYQAEMRAEAADWLRSHLPPGTRVGAWNGGMLGYYSGQHVVMLDGLANSPGFYLRAIVQGDLLGYLRDERIEHLATLSCTFDPVLWTARSVDTDGKLASSYELRGPLSDRALSDPCNQAYQLWVAKR